MRWQSLYNPIVILLLRSPLHRLMSGSTMLITFTRRKSGRTYTTPVNYVREGDTLLIVSSRDYSWWKNLRGGAPVTVRVRGREMKGVGETFEGDAALAEGGLLTVLRRVAGYRRHFGVELDADGQPEDPEALAQVARTNALVRIKDFVAA
jgi:deazaflavin-dependent oxidoreductase (nitroreductase family)